MFAYRQGKVVEVQLVVQSEALAIVLLNAESIQVV
jgi:hypothetical protein